MSGYTILLPAAGWSSRYPNMRPKWMLSTPDGALMLRRALVNDFAPSNPYRPPKR